MDQNEARRLAAKGMMGYNAMLDPDTHIQTLAQHGLFDETPVQAQQPQLGIPGGELVAQNGQNEFGFKDRMKIRIDKEGAPGAQGSLGGVNIRSKAQADLNERLLRQGKSASQVSALESGTKSGGINIQTVDTME